MKTNPELQRLNHQRTIGFIDRQLQREFIERQLGVDLNRIDWVNLTDEQRDASASEFASVHVDEYDTFRNQEKLPYRNEAHLSRFDQRYIDFVVAMGTFPASRTIVIESILPGEETSWNDELQRIIERRKQMPGALGNFAVELAFIDVSQLAEPAPESVAA